jgi:predicted HTH domain antitoxin
VEITLPAPFAKRLTSEGTALHLAIGLYVGSEATLVQAAHVAGLNVGAFMQELACRRIPLNYGVKEFREDLETINSLPAE